MPVPPSLTVAEPVRLTVVTSMVSVTLVTAAAGLMARLSKLPPLAPVMVALTLPASMWDVVGGGGDADRAGGGAGADGDALAVGGSR